MQFLRLFIALNIILSSFVFGQDETNVVDVIVDIDHNEVRAGEQVDLMAIISINAGWHIYSSDLKGLGPVPSHFEIDESDLIQNIGIIVQPAHPC